MKEECSARIEHLLQLNNTLLSTTAAQHLYQPAEHHGCCLRVLVDNPLHRFHLLHPADWRRFLCCSCCIWCHWRHSDDESDHKNTFSIFDLILNAGMFYVTSNFRVWDLFFSQGGHDTSSHCCWSHHQCSQSPLGLFTGPSECVPTPTGWVCRKHDNSDHCNKNTTCREKSFIKLMFVLFHTDLNQPLLCTNWYFGLLLLICHKTA